MVRLKIQETGVKQNRRVMTAEELKKSIYNMELTLNSLTM